MSWSYRCPKCRNMLNPAKVVILVAGREGKKFLIGLHPEPGNYLVYLPPKVEVSPGERWDFFCPVCQTNLAAQGHKNMCMVQMVEGDSVRDVFFSRVAGQKMTFVHSQDGIELF